MNKKDWIEIIIIPFALALIAILWPVIQNFHRRYIFKKLIIRELREISPYPSEPNLDNWYNHCQKRFIHREIFENINENRDFILSLHPDLVYLVAQLWYSLEEKNWPQWHYCLNELSKTYDPRYNNILRKLEKLSKKLTKTPKVLEEFLKSKDIKENLWKWENLYQKYKQNKKNN